MYCHSVKALLSVQVTGSYIICQPEHCDVDDHEGSFTTCAGTADSAGSESMQLVQNTVGSGSPSSNAPLVAKATGNGRATHKLVKVPSSTRKVGSKRKACDV